MSKSKTKVKNKAPAEIQITAEQLLREAKERDLEIVAPPPKQKIADAEELADYQLRKRKFFEDEVRKNRTRVGNWLKYAAWEESQNEIERARSIFERALDVDPKIVTIWVKYAEMEMKNRQVQHARNLLDRAVLLLPRCNQLWYKYTYMEEVLANIPYARHVFERWMEWEPDEQAWQTYINFELRYKELERARQIHARFVSVHPSVKNWIKFAKFEERHGFIDRARAIYEEAINFFGDEYMEEKLFLDFAKFEERQREHDRATTLYKYALDKLPKEKSEMIFQEFAIYQKKHGCKGAIEQVVLSKRRNEYENKLSQDQYDYDIWIDYIRMVQSESDLETIRTVYERAIACIPLKKEKQYWRRYIYIWIMYAIFEELTAKDIDRTRQVYQFALKVIPHKIFTFAKIWLLAAKFEIRCKDLTAARKLLGTALGMCPTDKLFREYINLEIQLREFDRCRIIYQKFLDFDTSNPWAWVDFAELEAILGENERAEGIFQIAIDQPLLQTPEVVWKKFIDFHIENQEFNKARILHEKLLERTQHLRVWISFANFELNAGDHASPEAAKDAATGVYERAAKSASNWPDKESRMLLLEAWLDFETNHGTVKTQDKVRELMPRKIKKRRKRQAEDGTDAGWEEYFEYIFPSDGPAMPNLSLLQKASAWANKKTTSADSSAPSAPPVSAASPVPPASASPSTSPSSSSPQPSTSGASHS